MTCKSATLHTIIIQISATRTVRRPATAMEAALLNHSWQDRINSIRTKYKRFTTQTLHHKVGERISVTIFVLFFQELKVRNQLRPFQKVGGINQKQFFLRRSFPEHLLS